MKRVPPLSDHPAQRRIAALEAIADSVPLIIWYKDTHNNTLWANRSAVARSGTTRENILGISLFDLTPREAEAYAREDQEVVASRRPLYGIVHGMRLVNGERHWMVTDKFPDFDESGEVVGVICLSRDVTESREAAAAAAAAESGHGVSPVELPSGVFHTDPAGLLTFASEAWCRIAGITAERAQGEGWFSIVHPEDRSALRSGWEEATRQGQGMFRARVRLLAPDRIRPIPAGIHAEAEFARDGTVSGYAAGLSLEATFDEQVRADEEHRRIFDTLAATAPVGMFLSDAEGLCTYVNDRWCRIWGLEREQALGMGWLAAIHPDDRQRVLTEAMASSAGKYPISSEFRVLRRDGGERWVLGRSVPLMNAEGTLIAHVGTSIDITSRRAGEQEIRRLNHELEQRVAERTAELEHTMRELEAFCYAVSHDLRGPLRALDGFSFALLEEFGDTLPEHGANWLRRLRAGSQRMGRMIDDLLALSRLSRGSMRSEPIDLSLTAREVIDELRQSEAARSVAIEIEAGMSASGDPMLLRVVLQNLLGNAWKFTSRAAAPRIEFGVFSNAEGEDVYVVRDNGVGFNMDFLHRLFGMFERLHNDSDFDGTGIGLATVRRIIERHGGRVWAEGRPGGGAAFFFTLG